MPQGRLHELIVSICSQVRENQTQEDGTLCLAFLSHIISSQGGASLETVEKLWIEMHLLIGSSLKSKGSLDVTPSKEETGS